MSPFLLVVMTPDFVKRCCESASAQTVSTLPPPSARDTSVLKKVCAKRIARQKGMTWKGFLFHRALERLPIRLLEASVCWFTRREIVKRLNQISIAKYVQSSPAPYRAVVTGFLTPHVWSPARR